MIQRLAGLATAALLAGCVSFSSGEPASAPDYAKFCHDKEGQCREICGSAGVLSFSCKATPREGLEYRCQCRQPGERA
jgi:hypothetical protein